MKLSEQVYHLLATVGFASTWLHVEHDLAGVEAGCARVCQIKISEAIESIVSIPCSEYNEVRLVQVVWVLVYALELLDSCQELSVYALDAGYVGDQQGEQKKS